MTLPYHKQYARDRARYGPSEVDSAPFFELLRYARQAGFSLSSIGVDRHYLQDGCPWKSIRRATRERALSNLERLIAERQESLDDCRSALAFIQGRQPAARYGRVWPTAPLREAIDRSWPLEGRKDGTGSAPPLNDADRRYLYRSDTLDETRADRLCNTLGLNVEDVWPDWFDMEQAG